MRRQPQKQTDDFAFDGTVDERMLTVEYWHERYKAAFKRFDSFVQMADEMAQADPVYTGAAGVVMLQQIQAGRGKLKVVAKSVQLMEKLRPAKPPGKSLLSRQGINVD